MGGLNKGLKCNRIAGAIKQGPKVQMSINSDISNQGQFKGDVSTR